MSSPGISRDRAIIQEEFEQANQGVTSQLTVDEQKMLIQLLQKLNNGEADHGDTL